MGDFEATYFKAPHILIDYQVQGLPQVGGLEKLIASNLCVRARARVEIGDSNNNTASNHTTVGLSEGKRLR